MDFKFRVAARRGLQPSIDKMASSKTCISQLSRSARTALSPAFRPSAQLPPAFLLPFQQHRTAVQSANAQKYKRKDQPTSAKKKKSRTTFINHDLKDAIQFPLVDAMRYVSIGLPSTHPQQKPKPRLTSIQLSPCDRSRSSTYLLQVRTPPPPQVAQERSRCTKPDTPPSSRQDRPTDRCHLRPRLGCCCRCKEGRRISRWRRHNL